MLGKLIKNEFKATSRTFLLMYGMMAIVTGFLKIVMEVQSASGADNTIIKVLSILSTITYIIALLAVIFGTAIIIIKRFYDNMIKDEGYLSFTLPVSIGKHLASKAIVSYTWSIISVIVVILAIFVLPMGHAGYFQQAGSFISDTINLITDNGLWGYVIETIVVIIIGVYSSIMMVYTCLSVGQIFNKHKLGGAVIVYVGIYVVSQICNTIFMGVTLGASSLSSTYQSGTEFLMIYMTYALIVAIVESIVFTVASHFALSKHLNLE